MSIRSFALLLVCAINMVSMGADSFRVPASPLVTCDPYFSIWSPADNLYDADTVHWTGRPHRLGMLVRVDGVPYRVMGMSPVDIPPLPQLGQAITPTTTRYEFSGSGISLQLAFATPALPYDLDLLSRPTTYLSWSVRSTDGKPHDVTIYVDGAGEIAVNNGDEPVSGRVEEFDGGSAVRLGSVTQRVLRTRGDDLRIDWGYFYIATPKGSATTLSIGKRSAMQEAFGKSGSEAVRGAKVDLPAPGRDIAAAVTTDMGKVTTEPANGYVLLAYDDLYSIQYMRANLRPYWRRTGWEADDLLAAAVKDYDQLVAACGKFDQELVADVTAAGGDQYAAICVLAFRQCFAAGKFVADANGQPLQFCKENHSNGCIATSDVFYPMAPQFLLFGPSLAKSFVVPFMNYAASDRWRFPFAPHDLGTYPLANGQVYGGGERTEENQMPVEESGNMLLLMAAIAKMEGNADFAGLYWPQLQKWAAYLKDKGFDPENQLCTDDFAGHLAHNVNLSAKAICALGAYGYLCDLRGDKNEAAEYRTLASEYARKWVAAAEDGDHFRLAFDRQGTWSQKYNLVWDRILELKLFPEEVYTKEMAYYRRIQNKFGLPLDNRSDYTKLDWILWTATLTEKQDDFAALVRPVYDFLQATPDRSPMTDWYFTSTAKKQGFTARPVVGGVFLRMLYEEDAWKKHASRERVAARNWAPLPVPPQTTVLVPTSEQEPATWHYTTEKPGDDWFAANFDDAKWKSGQAGFGTRQTPGTHVRTIWNSRDIWLRRKFELKSVPAGQVFLQLHHDEDAEIYINGKLALDVDGYATGYELEPIDRALLQTGENSISIHCHQRTGGQYIDVGIVVGGE